MVIGIVLAIAAVLALAVIAGLSYRAPGVERNFSRYLTMRDGVRIAVDVWLPEDGVKAPALIKGTPYWRGFRPRLLGKAALRLGFDIGLVEPDVPVLNRRGYAVVTVDTRGTGASFGSQRVMLDDDELADYGEIVAWAAAQPWCNGKVGAYGFSYRGMIAARMAALDAPALKAVAPLFDFSDMYLTTHPGGVFAERFVHDWSAEIARLGRGRFPCRNLICPLLVAGPKPVDDDRDGALLAEAIAGHAVNYDAFDAFRAAPARDDPLGLSGRSASDISVFADHDRIEARGLPMFVQAGYFDGESPAQALRRFRLFANPQVVMLGPFSHGGFFNTDPFARPGTPVEPSFAAQTGMMADFFDGYLTDAGRAPRERMLRYFVLGAGIWRQTPVWPPADAVTRRWYLGAGNRLSSEPPAADEGADRYQVETGAGSGRTSRYMSPVALTETRYRDRARQDRTLLVYESPPLDRDIEIAGDPAVVLMLSSSEPDGVVIVYLEARGPDGPVAYLSEGVLRLGFRGSATDAALSGYRAADLTPMTADRAASVRIGLSPIAALIRRGHRIRLAVAGADRDNLEPMAAAMRPILTIERRIGAASYLELPHKPG